MSVNQSRVEKSELQYRRSGGGGVRSGNSAAGHQHRNFSGGSGSGRASASSAHRSFKKSNNAQGGQSRGNFASVNTSSNSNPANEARSVESGGHVQSSIHGIPPISAPGATPKPADPSTQSTNKTIPSDTSAQPSSMTSDSTLPSTPAKGDVGKGFPLQFGSISPNFVNGMQVPPRTSSAPPNLDEQNRDQVQHDASRAMPASPLQSAPRQHVPRKDVASTEQPFKPEANADLKLKRDLQVTSAPPAMQAQKPSILPMAGMPMPMPMPMPFHPPPVPMQFGGLNAQIQSQGVPATPLQMPMQMPLQMGNPQVQQQVFMPGLQHPLMQTQGIMHQSQSLGFNPQLGAQLPHQPGNLPMNMPPQINQQQAVKFGSIRKSVKITHPETHEELRLDSRDGGSIGSRAHHAQQSRPVPTYTPTHPVGYYPNSYAANRPFFPAPGSHPLPSTQLPTSSPPPRFNYPVSQGPPTPSFINQSSNSVPINMAGPVRQGALEPFSVDFVRDVQNILPPAQSTSTTVIVKAAGGTTAVKGLDSNAVENVEKVDSQVLRPAMEAGSMKESEVKADGSSLQAKSGIEHPKRPSPVEGISAPVNENFVKNETVIKSDSATDAQKPSGKKGQFQVSRQDYDSFTDAAADTAEAKRTHTSSGHGQTSTSAAPSVDLCVEDKAGGNQDAKQNDHPLQGGPRESTVLREYVEKELGGLQSDNSILDSEVVPVSANVTEANLGPDKEGIEGARPNSSSGIVSGSNKTYVERNKTQNNSGKKKRKEMLQKADALGTTSDLYMAYKGPDENKEVLVAAADTSDSNLKGISPDAKLANSPRKKKDEQNKPDLEDWEDAADDCMPKLESSGRGHCEGLHHDVGAKSTKYSRDFLLTFAEHCTDLPEGFQVTADIVDVLVHANVNAPNDWENHGSGRGIDRSFGGSRLDQHGNGVMDVDKWGRLSGPHLSGWDPGLDLVHGNAMMGFRPGPSVNYGVLRNPRGQGPVQHAVGILSGPMHCMGFQGAQRSNPEADRWQRATNFNKGLMPSPHTPMQAMHKAERKYEVGKVTDEEQAKQRRLKAILNKLTPQNFEKLFEQVKEVNIDNAVTLTGVISQIFDKALMEPTFCEMYANFCSHLAMELPDLSVENEKITFRRLLLNKCQEEFERGEREEEEANKADGEGGNKQSEEEREEKRLKARRRMLGNIRLIGELYKKRMLTERIMHECIKKLLGQYQNPDEENIEALCKLMSTIGEMIDHPKAKEHMDAYFDIMGQLSNNMKLSSRVRFLLKDAIDLRKNKWQQRRKVEGPKKIEEVHRDAAQERQGQAGRVSRGQGMNSMGRRGQVLEYAPRGSMMSSPGGQVGGFRGMPAQVRAYAAQDARVDERSGFENRTLSVPLAQRFSGDEPITLGPQGGLAKGMSFRGPSVSNAPSADNSSYGVPRRGGGGLNGHGNVPDRGACNSREDQFPRHAQEEFSASSAHDQPGGQELSSGFANKDFRNSDRRMDRLVPPAEQAGGRRPQTISCEKVWPEERLRDMSIAAIKEYYSANDEKEVALCIKDLNAPTFYPMVISVWVTDAFERKDKERDMLARLLVTLAEPRVGMFNADQLIEGFISVLTNLEDTVNDAPRAPEFLGQIFGRVIIDKIISFTEVGHLIRDGGEEPGRLLEAGLAADVLGSVLEMIKVEKGESILNEIRTSSDLRLEDFRPPDPAIRSKKLEMFI
ncbi:hypothetical protein Cgig2_008989 [Carnegiea gigantea]|uniref:Eukaryotic translation initiation factor 4G n=1 Tax=Carnegiea gigantea TaxID=171969 RepID=A0A9Q1K888_9CARY|nr:hypothetical protein Cgig2_008989 [Carnegiea gigantea]